MQYQMNEFLFAMILTELEDAVGKENCSTRAIDRVTHSVDYYWLSRMWADRGCRMPEADIIVCPKDAEEVSKVVIVSSYAMIPQIVNGLFYLIFSNVLLSEEAVILSAFSLIMMILSGIVLCVGTMVINEFDFFKFVLISIVTLLAMGVIIFVIFMVMTLDNQLITFIQSIFKEIWYR